MTSSMTLAQSTQRRRRPFWWAAALVAVVFGLVTIKAGGTVLFGGEADRAAAGNYVPFVLWFNFLAGFVYVVAGFGIGLQRRWGGYLALALAVTTLAVFALFAVHIALDHPYEPRTLAAMTVRSTVWVILTWLTCTGFGCRRDTTDR